MKHKLYNIGPRVGLPLAAILSLLVGLWGCKTSITSQAPPGYGAVPSDRQIAWHSLERYAFLHFSLNTFTGMEWGFGEESPKHFNPTDFDAEQIVRTIAQAGFKGVVLTAKHHDGFCLWPSAYTEYSVKNSPWKNGRGDMVKEIADACRKQNIRFGLYLSPWDRNHAGYGTAGYIDYYKQQLKELLIGYGELFMIWLDGANGGDGYYGGSRETRIISRDTYYPWAEIFNLVRTHQPEACIFSDIGPDVRWVGNEKGYAADSSWATYTPSPAPGSQYATPGNVISELGETGTQNGKFWMPAEADVSIRPGWFFHEHENDKVKTLTQLVEIYFRSVGNGAGLNLNIPPDRRGKINTIDSVRITELNRYLEKAFRDNLLRGISAKARQGNSATRVSALTDGDTQTYLQPGKKGPVSSVEFYLKTATRFNCLALQEYIPLGQRVRSFVVEIKQHDQWTIIKSGSTIGYKKLLRFAPVTASALRIRFTDPLASPLIAEIGLYNIPDLPEK